MNPYNLPQLENIKDKLAFLIEVIKNKDTEALHTFLAEVRKNIS